MLSVAVDPDDPLLEPVHGVSFELYAETSRRLLRGGVAGPDAIDAAIRRAGLDAATWREVQAMWVQRMHLSDELAEIYSTAGDRDPEDRP